MPKGKQGKTETNERWFQGRLNKYVHALMKAEAGLMDMTIIEYIDHLVKEDLRKKGYDVDAALARSEKEREKTKE